MIHTIICIIKPHDLSPSPPHELLPYQMPHYTHSMIYKRTGNNQPKNPRNIFRQLTLNNCPSTSSPDPVSYIPHTHRTPTHARQYCTLHNFSLKDYVAQRPYSACERPDHDESDKPDSPYQKNLTLTPKQDINSTAKPEKRKK